MELGLRPSQRAPPLQSRCASEESMCAVARRSETADTCECAASRAISRDRADTCEVRSGPGGGRSSSLGSPAMCACQPRGVALCCIPLAPGERCVRARAPAQPPPGVAFHACRLRRGSEDLSSLSSASIAAPARPEQPHAARTPQMPIARERRRSPFATSSSSSACSSSAPPPSAA